jgi:DNA (cytosine-5)-methyltransferase 1
LRVLDIFSGIGGFSLGLERTGGFKTIAFCEIEPFCQRVLAKHWPGVPIYDDVRELTGARLAADGLAVDVICGGFPCQDVSVAQGAHRSGLAGERSGLWSEYARLVRELRPSFVIVENVPGLLSLGIRDVLRDLAACGYDAEWQVIPAAAVGAPHIRDRVWLVGYANGDGQSVVAVDDEASRLPRLAANTHSGELRDEPGRRRRPCRTSTPVASHDGQAQSLADADGQRFSIWEGFCRNDGAELAASVGGDWWASEPAVGRVVDGLPGRVDRLRALGNAVVPQIPELIGQAILEAEGKR